MRKKNYKGVKCTKRYVGKCEDVCKTYDAVQYAYADLLSNADEVHSFRVNVLLEGLQEGDYTSDFVIVKADGGLMIREFVEEILVIDCVKKIMPVWKKVEAFDDYEVVEENLNADTLSALEDMDAESRKTAYQRYNIISGILPFLANEPMRKEAIKRIAEEKEISVQSVRKHLGEYLSSMDIRSLAPKQRSIDKELTADEKIMRKLLNRWFYNTKKRTLKNVYTLMLQNFYCDEEGKLLEKHPSYYQFRYFYRKYNKKETEYISRNGLSFYQRNQRPLTGDGVQSFAPTVGMGMLDATVCDIYLVNESGGIVGRPILTLCVDAYSGVVCGYSLSWEFGITMIVPNS